MRAKIVRAVVAMVVATLAASFLVLQSVGPVTADTGQVLLLGSTLTGGSSSVEAQEVAALGLTPVIVDDATWSGMTTSQFASYRAIILGDPTCSVTPPAAAAANTAVWGAAVTGNVIINGTDPVYHDTQGGDALTRHSVDFAVANSAATGAYISLSCYYESSAAGTSVPLLDGLRPGGFAVSSASCYNDAHIVATHPALAGISDATLSNWSCSVHEKFDAWPADFAVLAIAKDLGSAFTASDGTVGTPYILATGTGLRTFPLSLSPLSAALPLGATHTVTAQLLDSATSAPVSGATIRIDVTAGPNAGAVGTCGGSGSGSGGACVTGPDGTVAFSYTSNGSSGQDTIRAYLDQNGNGSPDTGEPQTFAGAQWGTTASGSCVAHGAGGWTISTAVSDNDGLVLNQARLGPRELTRRVSVPYLDITADWGLDGGVYIRRTELTPNSETGHPGLLTTTLLPTHNVCSSGPSSVESAVTYSVNGLPPGVTMWVKQSYRFDSRTTFCEPSGDLPCARFWPSVTWGVGGPNAAKFLYRVRVIQRLDFFPDGGYQGAGDILRDRSGVGTVGTRSTVESLGSNGAMKYEDRVLAISAGARTRDTWDSWHQTARAQVLGPGINLLNPKPGCSECVHAHWVWDRTTNVLCSPGGVTDCFTDGKPEILDGSRQTTYIAVVKYSPSELDPVSGDPNAIGVQNQGGYEALLDRKHSDASKLSNANPVMYWDMSSTGEGLSAGAVDIDGTKFPLGDAAWPQLPDYKHGGNGAMFFAPARYLDGVPNSMFTLQRGASVQIKNPLDLRLPAGWVLPVSVTYDCRTGNKPKGPFWISVTTSSGQRLLNPEGPYAAVPRGLPYTLLRTDDLTLGATPSFSPGNVVTQFTCPQPIRHNPTQTFTSYLVFSQPPTLDNVKVRLLGAPDGTDQFVPFDEP